MRGGILALTPASEGGEGPCRWGWKGLRASLRFLVPLRLKVARGPQGRWQCSPRLGCRLYLGITEASAPVKTPQGCPPLLTLRPAPPTRTLCPCLPKPISQAAKQTHHVPVLSTDTVNRTFLEQRHQPSCTAPLPQSLLAPSSPEAQYPSVTSTSFTHPASPMGLLLTWAQSFSSSVAPSSQTLSWLSPAHPLTNHFFREVPCDAQAGSGAQ